MDKSNRVFESVLCQGPWNRIKNDAGDFLKYVDRGLYAGGTFYRTVRPDDDPKPVKIEVVQGGLTDDGKFLAPIAHEPTNHTGLRHRNGTISIARNEVGTGGAGAFFICIGDQPELDFGGKRNPDGQGFAAFGHVTSGMKLIREIGALKTQGPPGSPGGELIASPVRILGAHRVPHEQRQQIQCIVRLEAPPALPHAFPGRDFGIVRFRQKATGDHRRAGENSGADRPITRPGFV